MVAGMEYAIQAEGLTKRFGKTTALAGVDLSAARGTVLGLLGPNGAGKTTAVRVLATQIRPDGGRATLCGLDVAREARKVRKIIGLTGQYASVDDDLTGAENLVLLGRLFDLGRARARTRAQELLTDLGLATVADQKVSTYSGGMRRRLDLAASMVGDPQVVFLDEPTTGLDPLHREQVWNLIRALTGQGVTVLLTTQYLDEADALADDICVIDQGKVIARGTPADLKRVVRGQVVVVRPADPAHLPAVAEVLEAVTGTRPGPAVRGELTVPVDSDGGFAEIVRRLEAGQLRVTELGLRLPSLDEVFFALTGHTTARQDQEQEQEVAA